jgi:hypothetical protein
MTVIVPSQLTRVERPRRPALVTNAAPTDELLSLAERLLEVPVELVRTPREVFFNAKNLPVALRC